MANTALCVCALALLVAVAVSHGLVFNQEATNSVVSAARAAADDGELAILLRGPHGTSKKEELLSAKYDGGDFISLSYFRRHNKVFLEGLHGDRLWSVSWILGSHARSTLLLVVHHDQVKLFAGCHAMRSHSSPDQLTLFANPTFKLFHEENAPVEVFTSERAALDSLGCNPEIQPPTVLSDDESDAEEVRDFMKNDARRKREQMQGDDYRANYVDSNGILPTPSTQRGDIPANAIETCDDEVIRHLQVLTRRIEQLHQVVGDQKGTIDSLRAQLKQCCRQPPPPPVERCSTSSCYPGY